VTDKEAMKLALDALYPIAHNTTEDPRGQAYKAITALKEQLLEAPMREVQRLGQEIEQEPICPNCKAEVLYECVACSSNNYPPQRTEQSGWRKKQIDDAEEEAWRELEKKNEST